MHGIVVTMRPQELAGKNWPPKGFRRHTAVRSADGTALYPETVEAALTFETPSLSEKVTDRALRVAKTRQTSISNIRESLDPHFLESLELMRYRGFGVFHAAWIIKATVDEFLFHGEYVGAEKAHETEEMPDCFFDKAFGFACSEDQLAKVEKARSEGRLLGAY